MAYGLRYTITQILRNGNNQVIEIYQKDYVAGIVKAYKPVGMILQPNSNQEYPKPAIISTQLNFSIILETQDDYDQFPDIDSQDDKKYWVILKEDVNVMWRGFLFNDYTQISFTTGIAQADFTCVDGISFLESIEYVRDDSINQLTSLLNVLNAGLSAMEYPEDLNLVVACSYFADGMNDRQDAVSYEPFGQTLQYRRDFMGESYYNIILNIMKSFNCRLLQANGDWWIVSINEMASATNYYTKYLLPSTTIEAAGILYNTVDIEPYQDGNVHFINNSQVKIFKKGFYNIQGRGAYQSALNYCDNGDLKLNTSTFYATGFISTFTGNSSVLILNVADSQFDQVFLTCGSTGLASFENGSTLHLPYIGEVSFQLSFKYSTQVAQKLQIKLITSSGTRYLDSNDVWQSSVQNLTLAATETSLSKDIPPYLVSNVPIYGYLQFKVLCDVPGTITCENFNIQRASSNVKYIETNFISDIENQTTIEVFDQPYGNNYPSTHITSVYSSNKGVLFNSSGVQLKNWYSSATMGTPNIATDMITYMTYQNIRNLNKNIATVECDLGEHTSDVGFVYLDKVFTTADTLSGNLSFSGKKFIMNRVSQNAYANQLNSVQLVEISAAQILASPFIITPIYITDSGSLGPFWNLQLTINTT